MSRSATPACVWTGSGWLLEDLGSKNGTTLNGAPASAAGSELREGDWICLGGLMARFEHLTAAQAANLDSERLAQVQTSAEMRRRLGRDLQPVDLLLRLLELAMEVATAERGFVLLADATGGCDPRWPRDSRWGTSWRSASGAAWEP